METVIYLIRHSKKMDKDLVDHTLNYESGQKKNEKIPLGIEGEERARKLADMKEFEDIDIIFSSSYTRALQTAKYLAEKKNLKILVDERFNERKNGIYEGDINLKKYYQEDFKNPEGESPKEVRKRMSEGFDEAVKNNKGKKIAIFSHGAAITIFLTRWCKLEDIKNDRKKTLSYNGKIVIDKIFDQPDVFKLTLNEKDDIMEITNLDLKW